MYLTHDSMHAIVLANKKHIVADIFTHVADQCRGAASGRRRRQVVSPVPSFAHKPLQGTHHRSHHVLVITFAVQLSTKKLCIRQFLTLKRCLAACATCHSTFTTHLKLIEDPCSVQLDLVPHHCIDHAIQHAEKSPELPRCTFCGCVLQGKEDQYLI